MEYMEFNPFRSSPYKEDADRLIALEKSQCLIRDCLSFKEASEIARKLALKSGSSIQIEFLSVRYEWFGEELVFAELMLVRDSLGWAVTTSHLPFEEIQVANELMSYASDWLEIDQDEYDSSDIEYYYESTGGYWDDEPTGGYSDDEPTSSEEGSAIEWDGDDWVSS